MKKFPTKTKREQFEIDEFFESYRMLEHGRSFKLIQKREKPDYIVEDIDNGEKFGVELTSVYIDDRSVPDVHMKEHDGPVNIPHDEEEIEIYKKRLIEAIKDKISKAEKYDQDYPIILSIYVNEYCSIYLDNKEEWRDLIENNKEIIDNINNPFAEIVFYSLPNEMVVSVVPEK